MAEKNIDLTVKLLAGQEKLESDVAVLKSDVSVLKIDVANLKSDVSVLKTDVANLKSDVSILKTDVANLKSDVAVLKIDVANLKTDVAVLKTDVAALKADVADLKEGQNRIEKFLLNLENIIMPKINAMYENSISNKQQIKELEEAKIKNTQKLENHELRITRLEQSR